MKLDEEIAVEYERLKRVDPVLASAYYHSFGTSPAIDRAFAARRAAGQQALEQAAAEKRAQEPAPAPPPAAPAPLKPHEEWERRRKIDPLLGMLYQAKNEAAIAASKAEAEEQAATEKLAKLARHQRAEGPAAVTPAPSSPAETPPLVSTFKGRELTPLESQRVTKKFNQAMAAGDITLAKKLVRDYGDTIGSTLKTVIGDGT